MTENTLNYFSLPFATQ